MSDTQPREMVQSWLDPGQRAPSPSIGAGDGSRTVCVLGDCTISIAPDASADEIILALTSVQRGRVARWQLRAAAVDANVVERRLLAGRLLRVHSSVYALPGTDTIPLGPDAAAVLACGPGGVLSHHSAAVLWELRPGVADPVHVTVPLPRRGPVRARGVVVHRSGILIPDDVRIHRGLPVTSPARAMLDVAVTLPRREVERLLDEAVYVRRIVTPAEIESLLRRAERHPGAANLAAAAADPRWAAGTDSENEERLLELVRAAGLPEPARREHVLGFRIDFLWPECAVAVEVDAYGTHGSPARFERDRRRDARLLTERGIVVLRFTGTMIRTAPLEVIATLSRAIAMRERPAREHQRYGVEPGHPDREAPAAPP